MYTNLHPRDMDAAWVGVSRRLKDSVPDGRRYPARCVDRVSVSRTQAGCKACRLGPAYNPDEFVEVPFGVITELGAYTSRRSIMRVGSEVRHYKIGTPMGHQMSCAKANTVCLDAELTHDEERERIYGDSERNLSLSFVDDSHLKVAYHKGGEGGWTRESASEYADQILTYPAPLEME